MKLNDKILMLLRIVAIVILFISTFFIKNIYWWVFIMVSIFLLGDVHKNKWFWRIVNYPMMVITISIFCLFDFVTVTLGFRLEKTRDFLKLANMKIYKRCDYVE